MNSNPITGPAIAVAVWANRLGRIREQLAAHDAAMCILTNPASLRHA